MRMLAVPYTSARDVPLPPFVWLYAYPPPNTFFNAFAPGRKWMAAPPSTRAVPPSSAAPPP